MNNRTNLLEEARSYINQLLNSFRSKPMWQKILIAVVAFIVVNVIWSIIKHFSIPQRIAQFFDDVKAQIKSLFEDESDFEINEDDLPAQE